MPRRRNRRDSFRELRETSRREVLEPVQTMGIRSLNGYIMEKEDEENRDAYIKIGNNLRVLRENRQVSLESLSGTSGVPVEKLERYENGDNSCLGRIDIAFILWALDYATPVAFNWLESGYDTDIYYGKPLPEGADSVENRGMGGLLAFVKQVLAFEECG